LAWIGYQRINAAKLKNGDMAGEYGYAIATISKKVKLAGILQER